MVQESTERLTIWGLRERLNITQAAMADRLGMSERQYRRWENGEANIPIGRLAGLAREFSVTYNELLFAIGEGQVHSL